MTHTDSHPGSPAGAARRRRRRAALAALALVATLAAATRAHAVDHRKSTKPPPPIKPYEKPIIPRPAPEKPVAKACEEILAGIEPLALGPSSCIVRDAKSGIGRVYAVTAGPDTKSWLAPDRDVEFWKRIGAIARAVALAHKGVREDIASMEIRLWGVDYAIPLRDVWKCGTRVECYETITTIGN